VWQGIEGLYRDNPSAREILQEVQRDRAAKPARSASGDTNTNPKR
jgi:hypothetical protein